MITKQLFDKLDKAGMLPFLIQTSTPNGILFRDETYPEPRHVDLCTTRLVNPRVKKDSEGKEVITYDRETYLFASLDFINKIEVAAFLEEAKKRVEENESRRTEHF